jgi:hypothetical protein
VELWTLDPDGKFGRAGRLGLNQPAYALATFGRLLVAQAGDEAVLVDWSAPSQPVEVGRGRPAPCLGFSLEQAAADPARGVWIPLGLYGVGTVRVQAPAGPGP